MGVWTKKKKRNFKKQKQKPKNKKTKEFFFNLYISSPLTANEIRSTNTIDYIAVFINLIKTIVNDITTISNELFDIYYLKLVQLNTNSDNDASTYDIIFHMQCGAVQSNHVSLLMTTIDSNDFETQFMSQLQLLWGLSQYSQIVIYQNLVGNEITTTYTPTNSPTNMPTTPSPITTTEGLLFIFFFCYKKQTN